jgi:hypothetical protein
MWSVCLQTTLADDFYDPLFQRGLLDVHMMVALHGAERTAPEWCALAPTFASVAMLMNGGPSIGVVLKFPQQMTMQWK